VQALYWLDKVCVVGRAHAHERKRQLRGVVPLTLHALMQVPLTAGLNVLSLSHDPAQIFAAARVLGAFKKAVYALGKCVAQIGLRSPLQLLGTHCLQISSTRMSSAAWVSASQCLLSNTKRMSVSFRTL
jgi:hypothetical protein